MFEVLFATRSVLDGILLPTEHRMVALCHRSILTAATRTGHNHNGRAEPL